MALDRRALDRAFREISRKVHPDRFPREAKEERRYALAHTERVNAAYQQIKEPARRAEHLLELRGEAPVGEMERTSDPDFLLEMLERQEEVAAAPDSERLAELEARAKARRRALLERLEAVLDRGEGGLEQAREAVLELRYMGRLLQSIAARREDLG